MAVPMVNIPKPRRFKVVFVNGINNCCPSYNGINNCCLVESNTVNPKLYSVGVPIKFPSKRRNFVECTINKKSHDLLIQFVNNRSS